MNHSRRTFLKNVSLTAVLLAGGGFKFLSEAEVASLRRKTVYRFAVASDGHYGQAGTDSDIFFETIVKQINNFHQSNPLQCCIINGDIIHNEKPFLLKTKQHLDLLAMPYYTGKGNHDMVSDEYWKEVWGQLPNLVVKNKHCHIIIANTSNEKGDYLSPNLAWLGEQLEHSKKKKTVFLVLHIPQKNGRIMLLKLRHFLNCCKNTPM